MDMITIDRSKGPIIEALTPEEITELEIFFVSAILNPMGPTLFIYGASPKVVDSSSEDRRRIIEVKIHHMDDDAFRDVGYVTEDDNLLFSFLHPAHCQLYLRGHALSKEAFRKVISNRLKPKFGSSTNMRMHFNLAFRHRNTHPLQREKDELKRAVRFLKLQRRLSGFLLEFLELLHPDSPEYFRGSLKSGEIEKFVDLLTSKDYVQRNLEAYIEASTSLHLDPNLWLTSVNNFLEKCDVDKAHLFR